MRFYGFAAPEIIQADDGMLDLDIDPKLAWALRNPERFPVDVNRADREMLLRVPGLGVRTVDRIIAARRVRAVRSGDLARLRVSLSKVAPFTVLPDCRSPGAFDASRLAKCARFRAPRQMELFSSDATSDEIDSAR
jgi:predicted DNA-binding helix-hairpin-helix protein